jgi:hypothetical protein
MLELKQSALGRKALRSFAKYLAIPFLVLSFALAPSFMPTGLGDTAQAKNPEKKVEFGLKWADKGLKAVEKAGVQAQKKRGIMGKVGGILKNSASGADKGVNAAEKGVTKASRGADKLISKSKVGRELQREEHNAEEWENKGINKAFRNCRGKACDLGKGAVKFAAPL